MSKTHKLQQIKALLGKKKDPTLWLFEKEKIYDGFLHEIEVTEQQFGERYNSKTDLMIFFSDSTLVEKYKDIGRCIQLYKTK